MKVLFEDEQILVIQKPAGLAVQTQKLGQQDLVGAVKNYLAAQRGVKGEPYVGLIHRLDQPVEGILVLGKTPKAAGILSNALTSSAMGKFYYAVIDGAPKQKNLILEDYLVKDSITNTSRIADKKEKDAKRAVLSYETVAVRESKAGTQSLLRIQLDTGRHHQIRVQLAHSGMPILGDTKYGTKESKQLSLECDIREVALCAYRLSFPYPLAKNSAAKKEMCFTIQPEGKAFLPFNGKF